MVVRYYGGVLLGTGGLVKAYGGGVGAHSATWKLIEASADLFRDQCDYTDAGPSLISAIKAVAGSRLWRSVTFQVAWSGTGPVSHGN